MRDEEDSQYCNTKEVGPVKSWTMSYSFPVVSFTGIGLYSCNLHRSACSSSPVQAKSCHILLPLSDEILCHLTMPVEIG